MEERIIIRKAKEEDAGKILEFVKSIRTESIFLGSHPDDKMPDLATETRLLRELDDNMYWLLATIDDELVGVLTFERNIKIKEKHRASFGVSVRKEHWGKKIGNSLMEEMLEYARNMEGLEKIELEVFDDNDRGLALYRKHGFEEEGRISKAFVVDGEYHDAVIMSLFLK